MYVPMYVQSLMIFTIQVIMTTMTAETTVPCSKNTLEELRSLKVGGQSYDELLKQMIDSFDREVTHE